MSQTVIRGTQILNNTVQRQDLDTSTVGQAVVTKLVQGSGITLSSTGADSGTGDVTVSSPDVVSTDAGNIATLGTDNHILVPQSQIWSVRLRSFNSLGNSTFECDQVNGGNLITLSNAKVIDCWQLGKNGSMAVTGGQVSSSPVIPGTSYKLSSKAFQLSVQTPQISLGTNDYLQLYQNVEGPRWRPLQNDVHSASLLVYSSIAPLKFGVAFRDFPATKSLVKLCTVTSASVWQLIPLANLPVWPAGNFTNAPGANAYQISVTLACGSTFVAPAADTWQNGSFIGAPGQDNWVSNAANTAFFVGFIQHEPGALCTTPIDCPFTQNYDDCLRYFTKSYPYAIKPGTVSSNGAVRFTSPAGFFPNNMHVPFKRTLAKAPTVTGYSTSSGAVNTVRDEQAGADKTVTGTQSAEDAAFGGFSISGANAAAWYGSFHYTADAGL